MQVTNVAADIRHRYGKLKYFHVHAFGVEKLKDFSVVVSERGNEVVDPAKTHLLRR